MKNRATILRVNAVQLKLTSCPNDNFKRILRCLEQASPEEIYVFPEGALSGYSEHDPHYDSKINFHHIEALISDLQGVANEKQIHLIIGTLRKAEDQIYNTALIISHASPIQEYRKINLAIIERGQITPGNALPLFALKIKGEQVPVGVQICRELRFPEQWRYLAIQGAQLFFFLTYTTGENAEVWKSHLVSRAAENQRFVVSANVAHSHQQCPTVIISPQGKTLGELHKDTEAILSHELDLNQCSSGYIGQSRTDVVGIETPPLKQGGDCNNV